MNPMFAILMGVLGLVIAIPFAGGLMQPAGGIAPYRASDQRAEQIEIFARAAWSRARLSSAGTVSRASMDLPPGFVDPPGTTFQAWSDGTHVYVWSASRPGDGASAIFPAANVAGVGVGVSASGVIAWRDGPVSPRPAVVPDGCLVIRMNLQ